MRDRARSAYSRRTDRGRVQLQPLLRLRDGCLVGRDSLRRRKAAWRVVGTRGTSGARTNRCGTADSDRDFVGRGDISDSFVVAIPEPVAGGKRMVAAVPVPADSDARTAARSDVPAAGVDVPDR